MSLISGVFTNYVIPAALSRPAVIGAGCLLAIPVLEMAKCAGEDFYGVLEHRFATQGETEHQKIARLEQQDKLRISMNVRAIGALIFGACALNFLPGSGAAGLLGFLVYSRFTWKKETENKNLCISIFLTGFGLSFSSHYKKEIAQTMVKISAIVAAGLQKVSIKVASVVQKILGAGKAFTKGAVKVISVPFKFGIKLFKPFIRHPLLGLGLLGSVAVVILSVKYGRQMTGGAALIAKAVNYAVKGFFIAGSLTIQGLSQIARSLTTALTFAPSVLAKTAQVGRTAVYYIFHPLQAIGLYKVNSAALPN